MIDLTLIFMIRSAYDPYVSRVHLPEHRTIANLALDSAKQRNDKRCVNPLIGYIIKPSKWNAT